LNYGILLYLTHNLFIETIDITNISLCYRLFVLLHVLTPSKGHHQVDMAYYKTLCSTGHGMIK
jgi:hypothetical protein